MEELNVQDSGGIVCTLEDREILEKMKQAKIQKLKEIEISKQRERVIDTGFDIAKGVVMVAGSVLTVVMTVCPVDGPVGEIATVLGSAALLKALDSGKELLKASLVKKDPGEISAALVNLSGNIKEIKVKDKDIVENVDKKEEKEQEQNNLSDFNVKTDDLYNNNYKM